MPTTIPDLADLTSLATGDQIIVRDVSEITVAPVKRATLATLLQWIEDNNSFPFATEWTEGTVTATTSGTAIDLTSLPSGLDEIEIWFDNVTGSGSDDILVQIGTGGSPTVSGYDSGSGLGDSSTNSVSSTAGMVLFTNATGLVTGVMGLRRITGNVWVQWHAARSLSTGQGSSGGGRVSLAGVLDNIRITSPAGTQTFDGGQISCRYR